MVKISMSYEGGLRCRLQHDSSGTIISTDAPKDNMGKGESFSPTDLVASALGSCMLTTMGIYAQRHKIVIDGSTAEVIKEMTPAPDRKIGKLTVTIQMCKGIEKSQREVLERAALTCPVHKNLEPSVEMPIQFIYPD